MNFLVFKRIATFLTRIFIKFVRKKVLFLHGLLLLHKRIYSIIITTNVRCCVFLFKYFGSFSNFFSHAAEFHIFRETFLSRFYYAKIGLRKARLWHRFIYLIRKSFCCFVSVMPSSLFANCLFVELSNVYLFRVIFTF